MSWLKRALGLASVDPDQGHRQRLLATAEKAERLADEIREENRRQEEQFKDWWGER